MTSLPIAIPDGYKILVKKGDVIKAGDVLAVNEHGDMASSSLVHNSSDTLINIAYALHISPTSSHKTLLKAPGDMVKVGDVLAVKSKSFGLKKEQVVSHVTGTIVRFERDTGVLAIKGDGSDEVVVDAPETSHKEISSPLDGTIAVCNNDEIVLESESKDIVGSMGSGGAAQGKITLLIPKTGDVVTGSQITSALKGSILFLPSIDKEAVVKASVVGVAGILGTDLSEDLFSYLLTRKIELPVVAVDVSFGKVLAKTTKTVAINGIKKIVVIQK